MNEAEHGTDSAVLLVTTSAERCADAVERELERQIGVLPPLERRLPAPRSARTAAACSSATSTKRPMWPTAGRPEHLQVAVDPEAEAELLDRLVNAGEILIGQHTLFAAGNFVIGCPASLPTGGFAHVRSGITADTFLKRTAVARADATRSPA